MKVSCIAAYTCEPAPEVTVRAFPDISSPWVDIALGGISIAVFRPTDADLRSWLQAFRGEIDAAVLRLTSPAPEDALRALTGEYTEWCDANGLPEEGSVDDLLVRQNLSAEQRSWLTAFITRWKAAQPPDPVPQQASSRDAADAAGGVSPPADAAGSADTDAAVLP